MAGVWLGARLFLMMYVCERERKTGREKVMTDSLAWLSAATRFSLLPLSCSSARLRYCFGGQLNVRLRERLLRKSPERKQKLSKGPFPTLFLAPVFPPRLEQKLPKQRDCLCRCPNSQPTHICSLAHRQRHTHAKKCYSNSF